MTYDDEYHILLDRVDKLTDRRQSVTTIYLSVNTAIIGSIAFLVKDGQLSGWQQQVSVVVLLIAGIVACNVWRKLITQYSTLLNWWYEQLRTTEENISNSSKLFSREYQELYLQKHPKVAVGLTRYESSLTQLFTLIYVVFGCAIVFSMILYFP